MLSLSLVLLVLAVVLAVVDRVKYAVICLCAIHLLGTLSLR
jgi:hypothetical protein